MSHLYGDKISYGGLPQETDLILPDTVALAVPYGVTAFGEITTTQSLISAYTTESFSFTDIASYLFANKAVDVLSFTEESLGYILYAPEYELHGSNWFLTLNIDFSSQRVDRSSYVYTNYFNNIRSEAFLDGVDVGIGELLLGSPSLGSKVEESQNTRESVLHFGKLNYFAKDVAISTFYPYKVFQPIAKSPENLSGHDVGRGLLKFGTFTFTNNDIDRVSKVWPIGLSNFFTSSVKGILHLDYKALVKFGAPSLNTYPETLDGFNVGVGLLKFGTFRSWLKSTEIIDSLTFSESITSLVDRHIVEEVLSLSDSSDKAYKLLDDVYFNDIGTFTLPRSEAFESIQVTDSCYKVLTTIDSLTISEELESSYARALADDTFNLTDSYLVLKNAKDSLSLIDSNLVNFERKESIDFFVLTDIGSVLDETSDTFSFNEIVLRVVVKSDNVFLTDSASFASSVNDFLELSNEVVFLEEYKSQDSLSLIDSTTFDKYNEASDSLSLNSTIAKISTVSIYSIEALSFKDVAIYSNTKAPLKQYLGSIYSHPIF